MATRSRGPSAGFGWLNRGFSAAFSHPKPLFGAAALVTLVAMLPTLITAPMQFHSLFAGTALQPNAFGWIMWLSMLVGLLVLPLYAGYLQIIDTTVRGQAIRVSNVFRPYRDGLALRVIGFGIAMLVVYSAILALILFTVGSSVAEWYVQALSAKLNHQPPPTTLPSGFGITFLLCLLCGTLMMGVYSIGLGQVALQNRSVVGAIADGATGALKNILPLFMLLLGLILAGIVVGIGFAVAFLLIALIGKLISLWLMPVLIFALYVAVILVVFTIMYGVMYQLWRDVCGDDRVTGTTESVAA
ncbi:hypothetical protein [Dyella mobilis]|uniref:Membrane domain of glycerophosphoryl diester phosphodiesterase n=1 Tax=Dyella mobilis TaxID=1849582 RepID=A0ABS2KL12_9GAMM|nr:hypothetical protein [Dyella mobilis]MBM7131857.1 hypothetical protein [Dyella mobilis]